MVELELGDKVFWDSDEKALVEAHDVVIGDRRSSRENDSLADSLQDSKHTWVERFESFFFFFSKSKSTRASPPSRGGFIFRAISFSTFPLTLMLWKVGHPAGLVQQTLEVEVATRTLCSHPSRFKKVDRASTLCGMIALGQPRP